MKAKKRKQKDLVNELVDRWNLIMAALGWISLACMIQYGLRPLLETIHKCLLECTSIACHNLLFFSGLATMVGGSIVIVFVSVGIYVVLNIETKDENN